MILAMALVLSLSALTGCGGKKQEASSSKAPTAQSQSVNPADQTAANAKKNEAGNQNSAGKKNSTAGIPRINVGPNANTKPGSTKTDTPAQQDGNQDSAVPDATQSDGAKTETSTTDSSSKSGSKNG